MAREQEPEFHAIETDEKDIEAANDIALKPGPNADPTEDVDRYISGVIVGLAV